MCGVAGIVAHSHIAESDISAMTSALSHRGPDAQGVFLNATARVALGHTRLSILDLSVTANQPMRSPDGRYVIVYNGEVYNYKRLRQELLKEIPGLKFISGSDTEVILHAFIHWGSTLCTKLEGMFAIAIYDEQRDELFLCRDRVGKKPLYYYHTSEFFIFASEIKSLLAHPGVQRDRSINYRAINNFLHLGYIPEPDTAYVGIRKFLAGHFAIVKSDLTWEPTSFFNVFDQVREHRVYDKQNAVGELKRRLSEAVEKRLVSDVPLGAFLSGGTDSSLIVALASQLKGERLKTFCIGFSEDRFDESRYAKQVASLLKTDHHEYILDQREAITILEDQFGHFDEPFADTSAIPTMLISKLARAEVTVSLTGDGGDELFLGYGAYDWATRLDSAWLQLTQGPISTLFKSWGNDRMKRIGFLLEKVPPSERRAHIFSQEQYFFTRKEVDDMSLQPLAASDWLIYKDLEATWLTAAEKQALFDIQHYLKDDLLVKVDRSSMYYALECRSPFLDNEVMAFALSLPASFKKKNKEGKWILKELLKEYLPRDIVYRRKKGFSIPLCNWLKNDLAYLVEQYLSKDTVQAVGIVKYDYVEKLKRAFSNGENFLYHRLWVLIVAHKWLNKNGS
jgi:asparagine synthase (glutamine-hydrolysing)